MVGSSGVVRENEGGMGMGRVMSRSVNDGTEFPISNSNYDTNCSAIDGYDQFSQTMVPKYKFYDTIIKRGLWEQIKIYLDSGYECRVPGSETNFYRSNPFVTF